MNALLDVNCLLALLDEFHPQHDAASTWFERNVEQGWATCPLTQNGYLRIRSQRGYPNTVSAVEAREHLLAATSSRYHLFIADDISLLDDALVRYRELSSHRRITDVYLLALAVSHELRLVTLDTGIPLYAVQGANESHLVVVV